MFTENIQTICRTSAILYADEMGSRKTDTIKRKFIEAIFLENDNKQMTIGEIAVALLDMYGLSFTEEEVAKLLKAPDSFVEVLGISIYTNKYYLSEERRMLLISRVKNDLYFFITKYIEETETKITSDTLKILLERYLYELLNSNINAYRTILNKQNTQIPRVDSLLFSEDEICEINLFLNWENKEKDAAIFKLVSYAIEYAIIINNSKESILTNALKNKVFYLDNAIIYRALGINGEIRKKRALEFLKKCRQSGQKLMISKLTRKEFYDSIKHNIRQLEISRPYGRIDSSLFKKYVNGSGMYQFYHQWRYQRVSYGFDTFYNHIDSAYKNLLASFNIVEDYKVPFDDKVNNEEIFRYKDEIQVSKGTNADILHLTDAQNIFWIEKLRNGNDINVVDTKFYFITPDQKLQNWDYNRSSNQPVTLLPSQWMAILLKYVSRTDDDYKSFVSFLNLPHNTSSITAENFQLIMAGISEITEDFNKQNIIVDSMINNDFQKILAKESPREAAKEFAKEKIEAEYEELLNIKEQEKQQVKKLGEEEIQRIKTEVKKQIEEREIEHKRDKLSQVRKRIGELQICKTNAESQAHKDLTLYKCKYLTLLIPVILYFILSFIFEWDHFEVWTFRIAIGMIILGWIYCAIYGKNINPKDAFDKKEKEYLVLQYQKFQYNQDEYNDNKEIEKELLTQLGLKHDDYNIN